MLENGTPYSGYYHKYDTGELYTNANWDPISSRKLLPLVTTVNFPVLNINNVKETRSFLKSELNLKQYTNPISTFNLPTQRDYDIGYYTRFFSVKRNDPIKIMEISRDIYLRAGGIGGLNPFLYKTGKIKWHLVGDEFDTVSESGVVITQGVIDNNKREVVSLLFEFPYIQSIFGDYRQFTIYSRAFLQ